MTKSSRKSSFHFRFNIDVPVDETEKRFINRLRNFIRDRFTILDEYYQTLDEYREWDIKYSRYGVLRHVASVLGQEFDTTWSLRNYIGDDFTRCLQSVEALYSKFDSKERAKLNEGVKYILSLSETDLGIQWRKGQFIPTGAELLDKVLVNSTLQWLSKPKYHDVLAPFQKGLSCLLESRKSPSRLIDTVRDMYEAIEKMARIVCANNKNLKHNAEQLISILGLSSHYSKMLKDYTDYAHEFRHAVEESKERLSPKPQEVEAFVYCTGLYLRLSLEKLAPTASL